MKKKFSFIILILGISIVVNAQLSFEENIITHESLGPHDTNQVLSADIDNDGDKDIVFSSRNENYVGFYKNIDGNGTFNKRQVINDNVYDVRHIFVSDIDGDGDMDVLSASWSGNAIVWNENVDGLGNFGPAQVIDSNAYHAGFVSAVDIDQDNDIDVLSASGNGLKWYENVDGLGNFEEKPTIANEAVSAFATDIDDDEDIDMFIVSPNKLSWYENIDGEGLFDNEYVISTDVTGSTVISADIDGDEDMDVISTSYSNNKIIWYENTEDPDGLRVFDSQYIIGDTPSGLGSIIGEDIDSDGDVDLLTASGSDNKISWFENSGGPGLFDEIIVTTNVDDAYSVYFDDIDGDDKIDIISAGFYPYSIFWHKNIDGMGNFGQRKYVTSNAYRVNTIYSDDIDNDGDFDVLSASKFDNKIAWYENLDGSGNFLQHNISIDFFWAYSVTSSDLDDDGDADVICLGNNELAWFENFDGLGSFGNKLIIDTNGGRDIKCADIDDDGYMDIITALYNEIVWYKNLDGLGNFSGLQLINENVSNPSTIETGDFDGDGDIDILSASSNVKIEWSENVDGQGNFTTHIIREGGNMYLLEDVVAADMDNDSDLDVLFGTSSYGKIGWIENVDGNGNFSTYSYYVTTAFGTNSLYVSDLDGDQDLDILSSYGSDLVWFKNLNGQGAFGYKINIADNGSNISDPRSITTSNINGEGLIDIVASTFNNDKIAWYNNLGEVIHINEVKAPDVRIYPNPARGKFQIQSDIKISKLKIWNIYGQSVIFNMNNNQIDISGLKSGLYYVELTNENGFISVKKVVNL